MINLLGLKETKYAPLPQRKYKIIYADPPWEYLWGDGGKLAPERHYQTIPLRELCGLRVRSITDSNCVLALWVTAPVLPDAFVLINAWGFKYKTILHTWIKVTKNNVPILGMGSYTRSCTELLLLGMKGHIKRISTEIVIPQCLLLPREKHSKKPDIVRSNLVQLFGNLPKIELFARNQNVGWDSWGNEI